MQSTVDPYSRQSSETKRYATVGAVLLLIAALLGLFGRSLFGFGTGVGAPVLSNATGPGKPVTQAAASLPEPVTAATASPNAVTAAPIEVKTMPKDVLDWLKHLERIENKRKDMAGKQVADLLFQLTMLQGAGATEGALKGLLGDEADVETSNPAKEIGNQAEDQRKAWAALIKDFDSLPPPPECVPIRDAYSQCLGETSVMINDVLRVVGGSTDDPKAAVATLMKMRGQSESRIDVAGKQSDRLVQDVCDKYEVRKWFTVNGDIGGSMGGMLGGLGGK
ncbi:MAG: hypothetical protein JSS66_11345 [Armatimonadetes bacterium]|nr:hypothetical protein [Armatimonadota bacterium]